MTFREFQKYLGKKVSEFSDMANKMTTDILRDIYMTASSSYQDAYFKSLMIDLDENNGISKAVVDNTYKGDGKDEDLGRKDR